MNICESDTGDGCGRSLPTNRPLAFVLNVLSLQVWKKARSPDEQWKACPVMQVMIVLTSLFLSGPRRHSLSVNPVELLGRTLLPQSVVDVLIWGQHSNHWQLLNPAVSFISFPSFLMGCLLWYSDNQLVRTALETSRSRAADARLMKQPQPVAKQLHTTAGLTAAKGNTVGSIDKVFIEIQSRRPVSQRVLKVAWAKLIRFFANLFDELS